MTSSTDQSAIAALLATGRVKFISALVVIALVLGIVTEGISISINYYTLKKLKCDTIASMVTVAASYSSQELHNNKVPSRWQNDAASCLGVDYPVATKPISEPDEGYKETKQDLIKAGVPEAEASHLALNACLSRFGENSPACKTN